MGFCLFCLISKREGTRRAKVYVEGFAVRVPPSSFQCWEPPVLPYQGPQWKLGSPPPPACFPGGTSVPWVIPPPTSAPSYVCFTPSQASSVTLQVVLRERRYVSRQLLFLSAIQESSTLHAHETIAPPLHPPLTELLDPRPAHRNHLQEAAL